jgi:hypothetical protein
MLVVKPTESIDKVICAKLVTGEEIVGRTISFQENFVEINRPLIFIMGQNPDVPGQAEVSFAPWMVGISKDATVSLDLKHVVFITPASKDVSDAYTMATGRIPSKIDGVETPQIVVGRSRK